LAEEYADRTVRFQDGKIIDDSHPHEERPKPDSFSLKKTSMNFLTALGLSFNNIRTKKGRTILTGFASSIGIIGIALILALSTGFQDQIDEFQSDMLAEFPIIVTQSTSEVDRDAIRSEAQISQENLFPDVQVVFPHDPAANRAVHRNIITDEFVDFVSSIDPTYVSSIGFTRIVNMNLLRNVGGNIIPISFSGGGSGGNGMGPDIGISSYPTMLDMSRGTFLERNYDLLAGEQPQNPTELVLVVDSQNRIDFNTLNALGFSTENLNAINFDDIIGTEFQLIGNDDYFIETEFGTFMPNRDFATMYNSPNNITLTIVGIVRQQPDVSLAMLSPGIAYSDDLSTMIINMAMDSRIVAAGREADFNIMTLEPITEEARETMLSFLGGNAEPMMMMIYPQGFSEKEVVINLLDEFNAGRADEDMIFYTDLADMVVGMVGGIIDGITLVLIAFAATSLVVSFIMIAIITYISVLERTKEIGILRGCIFSRVNGNNLHK